MADELEEKKTEGLDIQRILEIFRRRNLQFLVPLFFGWLLVWGSSWVLSPRFKSSTLILVEQPTMPQNYVEPNITDDLQTRLQSMTEQILSRTRLLVIIQRLHLYDSEKGKVTDDQKVDGMRKDIGIELVKDPQKGTVSAFRISYLANNPRLAQQVTTELTTLFISENLKVREQESQGTTTFLEQQLQEARENLAEQEAKVQQFEAQHIGALPTQEASNLQILAGLQSQLQGEQDALNTAKQQRVYLETLLAQEQSSQSKSRLGADGTDSSAQTDLATIDKQLDTLRAQLAELSSKYTDRYPDVQRLKDEIAKTEAMRESLVANPRSRGSGSRQPGDGASDPALNAGRQLQGQLQANQLEIANRESSIESLKARINDYQGRLNLEPSTEQQLEELTRGYEQSKTNYDGLLKKKDDSEMATSMEQMQQGERFTMLDPPSLPSKPDFPDRLKFCGFGLAAGLALGLLVVAGFEFMDDRLHSEREIKSLLPIAVFSEIPEVVSPFDERSTKRKLVLGWATTAFVVVTILAGSVFSFLRH
jgi:polysaccharide chain length determinant protein (PEP-CTERM system associated)